MRVSKLGLKSLKKPKIFEKPKNKSNFEKKFKILKFVFQVQNGNKSRKKWVS